MPRAPSVARRTVPWAILLLALALPGAASPSPFVTRAGTGLLLDGSRYRFTGVNIYNANSTGSCWYTMASGPLLDDALTALGPGGRVFRAWFFQSLAMTSGQRDWSAFDHTLAVAGAHDARVIVTLANQWPDCEEASGYKDETWFTTRYTEPDPSGTVSYRDWVAEVVTRYRDDPTVLAWQLVNEAEVKPTRDGPCSTNAAGILASFAADVSGLVKALDPNHLVSLGTLGGGQCGAQGSEYQAVHDVPGIDLCEYHDYQPGAPMPGDQFNGLQVRIDQCRALDKPIFVGETGIRPTDVGGTLADRAAAFEAKFGAQFAAGVVGEVAWAWDAYGSTLDNYDIGPGDPALAVLARWAEPPCTPTPRPGCRRPTLPGKAAVSLKDSTSDTKDALSWKWASGAATTKEDFGDPLGPISYQLCLYDTSGGTPSLVLRARALGGGACAAGPCWTETRTGFKYVDLESPPKGLFKLILKAGAAGKAKVTLTRKGERVGPPALPFRQDPTVTVQLANSAGQCWEAIYSTSNTNLADRFKAKAD